MEVTDLDGRLVEAGPRKGVTGGGWSSAPEPGPSMAVYYECVHNGRCQVGSRSVAFAVAEEDIPVLEALVEQFGGGNRSEFLRQAMKRMRHEAWAAKMRDLQAKVHAEIGQPLTRAEIDASISAVLAETRG